MSSVRVEEVSVSYDGTTAVRAVSLRADAGGWVGLIGPNGAGKTSLLRAVAGLLPHEGEICLDGRPVASMDRRMLSRLAAYLPQRPLLPASMSVTDYAMLGRTAYIPYLGMEGAGDRQVVSAVLDRLELRELASRSLGSLSGGEAQRAVLARALAQEAPVLLLDEPTAALDVGHQQQVLELIDDLRRERALTVISAMHDLTLAGQFAERLVLLSGGRAIAEGPARVVLTESAIREHYGASVRVVEDPEGAIAVIPTRGRTLYPDD